MVGKFLVLAIVGIIGVRLFQRRIETVAETFRHEYRRSLVFGIVIAVLSIFAFLLGPILYPLMGLAALMGYIAAAHAIGEIRCAPRRIRGLDNQIAAAEFVLLRGDGVGATAAPICD